MKAKFKIDCFAGDTFQWSARLEVDDLPFAPTTEMGYQHRVWSEDRKAKSVAYDLEEGHLIVYFGQYVLASKEQCEDEVDKYKSLGWTVNT